MGPAGTCSAPIPGQTEPSEIGQIQVASFPNTAGLQEIGDNYLVETAASGPVNLGIAGLEGRGNIRQGMLEGSNVNVVEELVDMIRAEEHTYELQSLMRLPYAVFCMQ